MGRAADVLTRPRPCSYDTFVTRPEVGAWFDLTRKIGVNVNAGYMIARPRVTIRSTLADESERIRADMFSVKIGMVYRIF